jgi:hypothetical protein
MEMVPGVVDEKIEINSRSRPLLSLPGGREVVRTDASKT